jgi:hypothetical protein
MRFRLRASTYTPGIRRSMTCELVDPFPHAKRLRAYTSNYLTKYAYLRMICIECSFSHRLTRLCTEPTLLRTPTECMHSWYKYSPRPFTYYGFCFCCGPIRWHFIRHRHRHRSPRASCFMLHASCFVDHASCFMLHASWVTVRSYCFSR